MGYDEDQDRDEKGSFSEGKKYSSVLNTIIKYN